MNGKIHKPGKKIGAGWTAKIYEWNDDRALKLFESWAPVEWVEYEIKAIKLAYEAGLPVPRVDGLFSSDNRNGIVMERITGGSFLPLVLLCRKKEISSYAKIFAGLHAEINSMKAEGLQSMHSHAEYKIKNEKYIPENIKNSVLKLLENLPDGDSLCHFDFHLMNILNSPDGPVIIDWTGASRGDPAADAARTWLLTTLPPVPPVVRGFAYRRLNVFYDEYIRVYKKITDMSTERIDQWKIPVLAARLIEERSNVRKKFLLNVLYREMKRQNIL